MNFLIKRLPGLPQVPAIPCRTRQEAENWIYNQQGQQYGPDAYFIEDMAVSKAKD